jgi:biotin carboxylase
MLDAFERFLCISSEETGHEFLRQCTQMGVKPTLLTLDILRDGAWPREALEDLTTMPAGLNREQILNTVSWMARGRRYDRVVALDESDLETAAQIREHWRIPGMGTTTASCYRDKLAMRVIARAFGCLVPEFCRVLNYDELRDFMGRVPAPWLLKPRTGASKAGTQRIEEPEQLWRALDELGDRQSRYVLEQLVPGDVFLVDSIVSECEVKFSVVHQIGHPSTQSMYEDGLFTARTVDRGHRDWKELTAMNNGVAPLLGMVRGVAHARYIRAHADGRCYFLEVAARVGGAFNYDLVEVATGVNLWREWARQEVCELRGETYVLPEIFESYAGSVLWPAQTGEGETAAFDDPEIVTRIKSGRHVGLIVRATRPERVKQLLEKYSVEFERRFSASMPPSEHLTPA